MIIKIEAVPKLAVEDGVDRESRHGRKQSASVE